MTNIFVGNLSYQATEDELNAAFAPYGTVERVSIVTDRATGQPRGFAFVEMTNKAEAEAAISHLNGAELHGRAMNVNRSPAQARGRRWRRRWSRPLVVPKRADGLRPFSGPTGCHLLNATRPGPPAHLPAPPLPARQVAPSIRCMMTDRGSPATSFSHCNLSQYFVRRPVMLRGRAFSVCRTLCGLAYRRDRNRCPSAVERFGPATATRARRAPLPRRPEKLPARHG